MNMFKRYEKIPASLHFTLHTVNLKRKINSSFKLSFQRGSSYHGATDLVKPDEKGILKFESSYDTKCTLYLSKQDATTKPKKLKIILHRFTDQNTSKIYGKIVIDVSKYYGSKSVSYEEFEMESGRSIPPVLGISIIIKQAGQSVYGAIDQSDKSFIDEDTEKIPVADWDKTEIDNNDVLLQRHTDSKKKKKEKKRKNESESSEDKSELSDKSDLSEKSDEKEEKEEKPKKKKGKKKKAEAKQDSESQDKDEKEKTHHHKSKEDSESAKEKKESKASSAKRDSEISEKKSSVGEPVPVIPDISDSDGKEAKEEKKETKPKKKKGKKKKAEANQDSDSQDKEEKEEKAEKPQKEEKSQKDESQKDEKSQKDDKEEKPKKEKQSKAKKPKDESSKKKEREVEAPVKQSDESSDSEENKKAGETEDAKDSEPQVKVRSTSSTPVAIEKSKEEKKAKNDLDIEQMITSVIARSWSSKGTPVYLDSKRRIPLPAAVFTIYAVLLQTKVFSTSHVDNKEFSSAMDTFFDEYENAPICDNCTSDQRFVTTLSLILLINRNATDSGFAPERVKKFTTRLLPFMNDYARQIVAPLLINFEVLCNRFATARFEVDPLLEDFREVLDGIKSSLMYTQGINEYLLKHFMQLLDVKLLNKLLANPVRFVFSKAITWNSFLTAFLSAEKLELPLLRQAVWTLVMAVNMTSDNEPGEEVRKTLCPTLDPKIIVFLLKNYKPDEMMPTAINWKKVADEVDVEDVSSYDPVRPTDIDDYNLAGEKLKVQVWNQIQVDNSMLKLYPYLKAYSVAH